MVDQVTFKTQTGEERTVKVGDYIEFKCDVEQSAQVTKIQPFGNGYTFTVKAPPDGFSGQYIGRSAFAAIDSDQVF